MKCRWLLLLFCLGIFGCKKNVDQSLVITNALQLEPYVVDAATYPPDDNDKYPCTNPLNYAPYPEDIAYQKTKEIRVNVHFMCSEDKKHGFVEGGVKWDMLVDITGL